MKTKLIFFALLLFLCPAFSSNAQSFKAGLLFNTNGIHFSGENHIFWESPNGKVWGGGGLSGGVYVKNNISEKVHLALELRYVQKGSVFEYGNEHGTRSVETMRINYAEIPVLIGYKFRTNKSYFLAETGLAYGKQISSDLHLNKLTSNNSISDINYFKLNDVSWIASLKTPINKKENLLLGIRSSYSLSSIHDYYKLRNLIYGIQLDFLIN